jgi:hypothetical protein
MLRDSLRTQLLDAIGKAELMEHGEALVGEARECVHFFHHEPQGELAVGASKVGGLPDLPESVEWPDGTDLDGRPHGKAEFLAQFNLSEVPAVDDFDLPRSGHLWLFVRNTSLVYGSPAIVYREEKEPLKPRAKPPCAEREPGFGWHDVRLRSMTFEPAVSLPLSDRRFRRRYRDVSGELHELRELIAPPNYGPFKGIDGQMGGFSYQAEVDLCRQYAMVEMGHGECIANDMDELPVAIQQLQRLISNPQGPEPDKDEAHKQLSILQWILDNEQQIQAAADSFQLLCSFRNNYDILNLGDGMYLDFLMHREALRRRDFSGAHCAYPMLL